MIPVLYDSITEGSVPANFGRGPLTDTLACSVHEARNAEDELVLEYAANGIHAEDIQPLKIILAKPNYTDAPQLFEIYKVGKTMNGRFTVNARHISYRLSNKLITSGVAYTCVDACTLLTAQAGNFTINTDKTAAGTFHISEPSSVRSWFGGKKGSLLDVFGGEWKYDNFTASLLQARGADRGVTIRNGKNLTQLSQEISIENLATAILPFYIDMDGNVTTGAKINTGLVLNSPREIAVDFSQQVDPDSATPIVTQLATLGAKYISDNNFTVAINSITLGYEDLEGFNERVDLCDTVKIYFEALGISATAKCVATTWDVLEERYTACTFGAARPNIADTIATTSKELAETPSRSYMSEAITRATELITGNLGGYVVLHDSNGDGYPDELLIMDTPDIATATKVWRWNSGGLGYSGTGYSGPYGTAITQNGQIVANYVNTGVLNADIIKAGTIQDTQGNSSINMTTGEAKLNNLKAKLSFQLLGTTSNVKASINHMGTDGAQLLLYDNNNHALVDLWAHNGNGSVQLNNTSNQQIASLGIAGMTLDDGAGNRKVTLARDSLIIDSVATLNNTGLYLQGLGEITAQGLKLTNIGSLGPTGLVAKLSMAINKANGDPLLTVSQNGYGRGQINLYNEYNSSEIVIYGDGAMYLTSNIAMYGPSGNITCVSVTQTSSRKTKDNIKPIEDAARILELQAVSFDFKNKSLGTNKRGFIAEDVEKVLPGLVTPETENTPAALDYVGMIPYLQQIIKEHEKRIADLEETIKEMKARS